MLYFYVTGRAIDLFISYLPFGPHHNALNAVTSSVVENDLVLSGSFGTTIISTLTGYNLDI